MDEHKEFQDEEVLEEELPDFDKLAEETSKEEEPKEDWELPKASIGYVMLIVAVICGGNGIGILAAGLYWKATGNLPVTIGIVVGMTLIALAIVAVIVSVHKRHVQKRLNDEK